MSVATVKRDYYEVLSVSRTADGDEVKRSYRRLAMKYHPDRNQGDGAGEAEIKFKECSEAYEVLVDPAKRQRYDQFGHAGVNGQQHDFSHMDVSDIFSMFDEIFGGRGGGGAQRGQARGGGRGFDLETQVELTLKEVAEGAEKTIEFEKQDACQVCMGTGAKAGTIPITCPQCQGQGRVAQQGFGGMFRMVTACPNCRGRGTIIKDSCKNCGGTGRQMRKRTVTVKIPAGVHDGQGVRVPGEGEAGENGAPPGDLHCYVSVRAHPMFHRQNDDLVCQVPISFTQATLGAKIDVPTLKSKESIDLPAGTQHGEVFKLKGRGLPNLRSHRAGDQIVQVLLEIPKRLSEKQKQLLREFADAEDIASLPQRKGFMDRVKEMFAKEE